MRASPRFVVVVVAVVGFLPESAWAQRASASLRPVQSGTVDALGTGEAREMCLRPSRYVLAFDRERGTDVGWAMVHVDQEPFEKAIFRDPEAVLRLSDSDQDGWGWTSFDVDSLTCLWLFALSGRARVYELHVRVNW